MTFQIIIRNKTKYKGRSVTEFAKNLRSEGYAKEVSEATIDRIKHIERREGRPLNKSDIGNLGR